jgi:hypothetical protein
MSAPRFDLETLSKYFHLPINDVARELGVCATVLKKICRKSGIPRWPHRKIKSLDKMIVSLEKSSAKNPEDQLRIAQELETLKNKRDFLMRNPIVLASDKKTSPSGKTTKDKVIKKKIRNSDSSSYSSAPSSPMSKSFDSEGSRSSESAMELESFSLNKVFEVFSRLQQQKQPEQRPSPVIPVPVNVRVAQTLASSPNRQLLEPSTRSVFLSIAEESDPLMQLASLSEFELGKSSPVREQPASPKESNVSAPFLTLPPLPVQKPIPGSLLFFPSFPLVDRNNNFAFVDTNSVSPLPCNFMPAPSSTMIHVE